MTFYCSMGNPADGSKAEILGWAAERLGITAWTEDSVAIGVVDSGDGKLVAAAIYNAFHGTECSIHLVSDGRRRWLTERTMFGILGWPFNVLGLTRLSGYIAATRTDALILALRVGFRFEGCLRKAFRNEDVVVMGLLREEAEKWLNWSKGNDGQGRTEV